MKFGIIEIGSNNTKTHIYDGKQDYDLIFENSTTIEFKANYKDNKIKISDLEKLCTVIENARKITNNIYIYGCSIFRIIDNKELERINKMLLDKYHLKIEVVTQEEESFLTAYGCYNNINYNGNICIFIGGGGSIEIIVVNNGKIIEKKFFEFGVVDITKKFETLKSDIPSCSFDEVYSCISDLIDEFDNECDVLILAGGDHLYWYNNAKFKLNSNLLYISKNQKYMISIDESDIYDKLAFEKSLDEIRNNSNNGKWFDGSRAMKVITNVISHKVNAKFVVPTKINMEDGLKEQLIKEIEKQGCAK